MNPGDVAKAYVMIMLVGIFVYVMSVENEIHSTTNEIRSYTNFAIFNVTSAHAIPNGKCPEPQYIYRGTTIIAGTVFQAIAAENIYYGECGGAVIMPGQHVTAYYRRGDVAQVLLSNGELPLLLSWGNYRPGYWQLALFLLLFIHLPMILFVAVVLYLCVPIPGNKNTEASALKDKISNNDMP